MSNSSIEWLYVATQPMRIHYGPTKIGWTSRSEPFSRIEEHERTHRRIELVVAFGLPRPLAWAFEQEAHRLLRRFRVACSNEIEWYALAPNECVIRLCSMIKPIEDARHPQSVIVETGPGWDRLLETPTL